MNVETRSHRTDVTARRGRLLKLTPAEPEMEIDMVTKKKPAKRPVVPQVHGVEINLPNRDDYRMHNNLMQSAIIAFQEMLRALPGEKGDVKISIIAAFRAIAASFPDHPEAVIHHCNIFGGSPNGIGAMIDLPRDAEG